MITTINQIVDKLRLFVECNGFVEDFGYGEVSDISTTTAVNYPLLWATHLNSSSITIQNNTAIPILSFGMLSLDRINNERPPTDENGGASTNQLEVMSDRFQVIQDLILFLNTELRPLQVRIEVTTDIQPIFDDVDHTAGWLMNINFKLPYANCYTTLPNVGPKI